MGDVRVCSIGDSFVAGVGDPEHLGWTGRLAADSHRAGVPSTTHNLGVRLQTSVEIADRLLADSVHALDRAVQAARGRGWGVLAGRPHPPPSGIEPPPRSGPHPGRVRGALAMATRSTSLGPALRLTEDVLSSRG